MQLSATQVEVLTRIEEGWELVREGSLLPDGRDTYQWHSVRWGYGGPAPAGTVRALVRLDLLRWRYTRPGRPIIARLTPDAHRFLAARGTPGSGPALSFRSGSGGLTPKRERKPR